MITLSSASQFTVWVKPRSTLCVCVCVHSFSPGEVVIAQDKAVQMSPLQIHCINKRLTLPMASSGKRTERFSDFLDWITRHTTKTPQLEPVC